MTDEWRLLCSQEDLRYLVADSAGLNDPSVQSEWAKRRLVWVPHEMHGFVSASVLQERGDELLVELQDTGKTLTVSKDDVQKMNPPKFDKVADMADLTCLNEASVLHNLKARYYSGMIYTYSGLFCVVINPYKKLPIYTEKIVELYKGKKRHEVPPHVFAITDTAYRSMLQDREDQSILCTGESGAGKTENTKKVIQYLAYVAGASRTTKVSSSHGSLQHPTRGELEQQLLQANPILEAFGNAKTVKNDNSSRFGKFIRINFDMSGFICSANIESYLLEKSRANRQAKDERSFHIFYQFLHGTTAEEKRTFLLNNVNQYRFLANGNISLPGVDDAQEFHSTIHSMRIMNFLDDEISAILRVVSAVLHFGNMEFIQEKKSDQAILPDDTVVQKICHLLGLAVTELAKALLRPRIKVGRDYVHKAQSKEQAEFSVEAISKACYERMFKWLVNRINKSLDRTKRQSSSFIGILDIAGFEIFELNSFEQLCINYTNEKLQQLFNHTMFVLEQEEYQREGIEWQFIDFGLDLQPTIDLIEKPMGILSLLDEECWFPKATDKSYTEKLKANHSKHPKFIIPEFKAASDFALVHYAGRVDYLAEQWLMKNMDPLNENVVALLQNSSDPFVVNIWKDAEFAGIGVTEGNETAFGIRTKKGMFRTVSQLYKEQLSRLMATLRNCTPHFVRCIIPNYEKKTGKIDSPLVLEQLRCNGVLEGIRICRQGFPNRIPFQEFRQRYEILTPNVISKGFMDGKEAVKKMIESLELEPNLFRIGQSKIFFRAGVLAQLEEERDLKLTDLIINFQANCRGLLARRNYQKRVQQYNAIRVIQRNGLAYLKLRHWQWWRLFTKVKPLLQVTNQEEKLLHKEEELRQVKDVLQRQDVEVKDMEKKLQLLTDEKTVLAEQLQAEAEACAEAEEMRVRLLQRTQELQDHLTEMESRLEEEEDRYEKICEERRRLTQNIHDLENQLEDEEATRQKLLLEKVQVDSKLKRIEESYAALEDAHTKLQKEKKAIEERCAESSTRLSEEEDKAKYLARLKAKYEMQIAELEETLNKERQLRQELEKAKRKLEAEVMDLKEQVSEKSIQLDEMQQQLTRRDEEMAQALSRVDEETASKLTMNKQIRELESQLAETVEDLESEKVLRAKADKQKRDLAEELETLKTELEESHDHSHIQQELRTKREEELAQLKKTLEDETSVREQLIHDTKQKYLIQIESLTDLLEQTKKAKQQTEKSKALLESENSELANDLLNAQTARQEADKRRKAAEAQLSEMSARFADMEKSKNESHEAIAKYQVECESAQKIAEEAEQKLSVIAKSQSTLEKQLVELQESLQDETRLKLGLQTKLRQLESDFASVRDQKEELEEAKQNSQKHVQLLQTQLNEMKKKNEEVSVELLEDVKKKAQKEVDAVKKALIDVEAERNRMERSKKKIQEELEDAQLELSNLRSSHREMEKKQRRFDQLLAEERNRMGQMSAERDSVAQELRERETKILSLNNDLQAVQDQLADSERQRRALQVELDEIVSSTDTYGKNVHELEKAKRALEDELATVRTQMAEVEDNLQINEDVRLRLEVNLQALKAEFERNAQLKDGDNEEKRKQLNNRIRDLEEELENERTYKNSAVNSKRNLEQQIRELEMQVDSSNRYKEDMAKQLKKATLQVKELQRELEEARQGRDDTVAMVRDIEKRCRCAESEITILQSQLDAAVSARKQAETERDDLSEQLSSLNAKGSISAEDRRRLEDRIRALEEELDDELTNSELANDRHRKLLIQVEQLTSDLSSERSNSQKLDMERELLERSIRDLRAKLTEAEAYMKSKTKTLTTMYEAKVADLENKISAEASERIALTRALKKSEKRLVDMSLKLEEERRQQEQVKEETEAMHNRLKLMKKRMAENDEETDRILQRSRKFQREVEELHEVNESLTKEISHFRGRMRRLGMDGLGSTKGNLSFAGFRSSSSILNKIGSNELLDASDGSVASRDESIGEDNNVPTSNGGTTNEGKTDSASLSWFGSVCMGPPDAILGLTEAYNRDTNKMKVNLGVGAYRDDNGQPFVLPSVRKVEEMIMEAHLDKEYAGIAGIPQFCEAAVRLAFGDDHPVLTRRLNATVQSISGTGALRLAAAFFEKFHQGPKVVWVPNPTWNNHGNILRHTGLGMRYYRYYDPKTCGVDETGLIDDLTVIPRHSIILLHVCAHNPTGVDLNREQWLKVSEIIQRRELYPWFDMAYQGFATGDPDRDAYPVRLFLERGHQLTLVQSFAKNMGLYGERVGALTFVGSEEMEAQCILSQLKILIRPLFSNPPIHGARIAHLILTKPELKQQWLQDLKVMTNRIMGARRSLKDCLEKEGSSRNWQHIVDQIGMFCYSGLSEAEVNRLIKDYSIYLTKDGRVSVAGISSTNVQYLARAIHEVTNTNDEQKAANVGL
ncbi:hypothetical protein M514_05674 [Trichuris suis]|uniref:aspartate transaminase n=1 Tax=Trichuris suis TaxID=68888 RepID=A0A085MXN0_9BILA|nr:hypothetical protein M514_05674 [Trichuris suis]